MKYHRVKLKFLGGGKLTWRSDEKMEKINVCGRVSITVVREFNENMKKLKGPVRGRKGVALETSMRIMNNYFKLYNNKTLIDIAEEKGLKPWKLGELIIKEWVERNLDN